MLEYDGTQFVQAGGGAGYAQALALSGSLVGSGSLNMPVAGMSCGKVVLGYASLTGGSATQEIPFLTIPAAWHIDMVRVNPATVFTSGTITALIVSVQQQGNTASPDILPPLNIFSGASFMEDIPANPNLSTHTVSFYISSGGTGNFSTLTAGSLEITYCGHVVL
jgi:hypothetical protein